MNKAVKINSPITSDQTGFTLMEVIVALVILMIALLGVFYTFSYAVNYNFSNSQRAQALGIVQQEIESMRSARFTPAIIDQSLTGGEKTPKLVTTTDGNVFLVQITVDDDPFTAGLQIDNTKSLKEITVSVTSENPGSVWQTSVPSKAVIRRVRGY
jgi:prepilin-type N-terminal cleavage/methylation domain-containing protein